MPSPQAPTAIVMIRPHRFHPNPETASDNAFQSIGADAPEAIAARALAEVDAAIASLRAAGVTVHSFDDPGNLDTPDAVFPNNWFSTHTGGHVAIFPMFAPNRRRERRADVIEFLKANYRVQDVIDYSGLEWDGLALEGTGAMVLDHVDRVAYTVRSNRADPVILERFCTHFSFEPMVFEAKDATGRDVYHTNVLMALGTDFVMISSAMITDERRRSEIFDRLAGTGRAIVDLTEAQIGDFAGNAMELQGADGRILALSARAHASLSDAQRAIISASARLLPLDVPTIETAGGSIRCMMAGIHLLRRNGAKP